MDRKLMVYLAEDTITRLSTLDHFETLDEAAAASALRRESKWRDPKALLLGARVKRRSQPGV